MKTFFVQPNYCIVYLVIGSCHTSSPPTHDAGLPKKGGDILQRIKLVDPRRCSGANCGTPNLALKNAWFFWQGLYKVNPFKDTLGYGRMHTLGMSLQITFLRRCATAAWFPCRGRIFHSVFGQFCILCTSNLAPVCFRVLLMCFSSLCCAYAVPHNKEVDLLTDLMNDDGNKGMLIILRMLIHACMLHSARWGDPVKHYSALATIRVGGEARFILLLWVRAARICRCVDARSNQLHHGPWTSQLGRRFLDRLWWPRNQAERQQRDLQLWCFSSCFHSYPCCAHNRFWSYSTRGQQERLWQTVPCSNISWSPWILKYMMQNADSCVRSLDTCLYPPVKFVLVYGNQCKAWWKILPDHICHNLSSS